MTGPAYPAEGGVEARLARKRLPRRATPSTDPMRSAVDGSGMGVMDSYQSLTLLVPIDWM